MGKNGCCLAPQFWDAPQGGASRWLPALPPQARETGFLPAYVSVQGGVGAGLSELLPEVEVIEIVDRWHGRQHLWHLAHAVFGEGSAEATAWAEPMAKALLDEGVSPVLDAIRTLQPRTEAAQEVVRLELAYFGDHASHMRYPEFDLAGWFRDGGERLQVGGRRPPKGRRHALGRHRLPIRSHTPSGSSLRPMGPLLAAPAPHAPTTRRAPGQPGCLTATTIVGCTRWLQVVLTPHSQSLRLSETNCFGGMGLAELLYMYHVHAVMDLGAGDVRLCTLAATREGRCRILPTDDTRSLGEGRVFDAQDMVAVPGLIDAHVHWGGAAQERWNAAPPPSAAIGDEVAAFLPRERAACLDHGVTAVQSMGDSLDWILSMRAAVVAGLPGPRVYAVGPIFTAPGGHPAGDLFAGDDALVAEVCRQCPPGEEAAAAAEVRALAALGIDAVKVVFDAARGALPRLDERVLCAIAAAAHGLGLRVHAHVGTTTEALTALELGADRIEHVPDPRDQGAGWDALAAALRARGAAICPTLAVMARFVPPAVVSLMSEWVASLDAAGVPVHAGTDLGNPGLLPGASLHDEMALLAQGGMALGRALAAATAAPGRTLGWPEVGHIADGARADWVVVEGDPLTDLGALRRPAVVVLGGRVVAGAARRNGVA